MWTVHSSQVYQLGEHQVLDQGDKHLEGKPHDHWDVSPITTSFSIVATKNVQWKKNP